MSLSVFFPYPQNRLLQAEEKENTQGAPTPVNSPRDTDPPQEGAKDPKGESCPLAATWEIMCKQSLGASQALAVLKAA